MKEIKERPIPFTGESVKAILNGRKTQTRRTRGLDIINNYPDSYEYTWDALCRQHSFFDKYYKDALPTIVKCPYGQVGDRLWVRETFAINYKGQILLKREKEDVSELLSLREKEGVSELLSLPDISIKWTPSIFMSRKDSQIDLEITEVRVERVQEISSPDIHAEGLPDIAYYATPIQWFIATWDSINAKRGYGWEKNPWVWVVKFTRLKEK